MNIKLKLKPFYVGVHNSLDGIHKGSYTLNNRGNGYRNFGSEDVFIGYVFHKVRKKTKQTKNKKGKTISSKIVREAHWIVSKYRIPYTLLDVLNKKFEQRSRHFVLVDKK